MFPAFSRMQDEPARILGALNRVNQVIAAIAFPTLAGLAILAPEFTTVVLGVEVGRYGRGDPCPRARGYGVGVAAGELQRSLRARLLAFDHVGGLGCARVDGGGDPGRVPIRTDRDGRGAHRPDASASKR